MTTRKPWNRLGILWKLTEARAQAEGRPLPGPCYQEPGSDYRERMARGLGILGPGQHVAPERFRQLLKAYIRRGTCAPRPTRLD